MFRGIAALRAAALGLLLGLLCAGTALGETASAVQLPAGMKVIEEQAFYGIANPHGVDIPEGVERIESQALAHSGVSFTHLPGSLTYIADDAYEGCSYPSFTAPLGSYAYNWCKERNYYVLPSDYFIRDGVLESYLGDAVDLTVPKSVGGFEITAIGDGAFSSSHVRTLVISRTVTAIGKRILPAETRWVSVQGGDTAIDPESFSRASSSPTTLCPVVLAPA